MKIAQINCVYRKGSTGRIVETLHHAYQACGHESFVLYGRGDAPCAEENVSKVACEYASKARSAVSRMTGNLYGMALLPTWRIQQAVQHIRPDVVHLHCINGSFCNIYRLVSWLKAERIPTVVTQHAEFFYTGNCGYAFECDQWKTGCRRCPDPKGAIGSQRSSATKKNWLRMKEAFEGFEQLQLVGVSDWVSERSNESVILGQYRCKTVLNGLDTSVFRYTGINHECKPIHEVIYVTPHFEGENKGGKWLLRLAAETLDLPIHYTVVGKAERKYSIPNVSFMGPVTNSSRLAELYSCADVCLLTSKQESFSMVTAEALCCGTPVIGFKAGAPERICVPEYCVFVPYGDLSALKTALTDILARETDKQLLSNIARRKYSCERMAAEYLSIYDTLTEDR